MEMSLSEFRNDAVKISLRGRLDTAGVDAIEKKFSVASESRHALVDLSGVSFVASMGIRMFFSSARVQKATGYRLILIAPPTLVNEVLDNAGLSQIVPVVSDEKLALELLPSADQPAGASAADALALAATVPVAIAQRYATPRPEAPSAHVDSPREKPAKPEETPAAKPAEKATAKPVENSAAKPGDKPAAKPAETPTERPARKAPRETATATAMPPADSRRTIWILAACSGIAVVGLAVMLANNAWRAKPAANPGAGAAQPSRPDTSTAPTKEARDPSRPPDTVAETPPKPSAETVAAPGAALPPVVAQPPVAPKAPAVAAQPPPGAPAAGGSAGATGTVRIAVKPWGEIIVDGVNRGVSPPLKRLSLPEGKHRIEVVNPGFPTYSIEIVSTKNQSVTVAHEFK